MHTADDCYPELKDWVAEGINSTSHKGMFSQVYTCNSCIMVPRAWVYISGKS